VLLAGLLAAAAFAGALVAVLDLGLVDCESSSLPGTPRDDLCAAPYQLLVMPPPALVLAGALLAWRRRRYLELVAGSGAALAVILLIVALPSLYPT
jgi:hypothetical protein